MLCAFEGKCDHCGHDHGNPFDRMQNFTEQADRITSLESHNRELLAVNQVLREALQTIARGPLKPMADPGAHSWEAFAKAWMAHSTDCKFIAINALQKKEV